MIIYMEVEKVKAERRRLNNKQSLLGMSRRYDCATNCLRMIMESGRHASWLPV